MGIIMSRMGAISFFLELLKRYRQVNKFDIFNIHNQLGSPDCHRCGTSDKDQVANEKKSIMTTILTKLCVLNSTE